MPLTFHLDDVSGDDIQGLLRRHLDELAPLSPPESQHALDLDGLRASGVTFWSVWDGGGGELVGMGALKELDPAHGEVKSMHTVKARRGKGIAARILEHIIEEARRRGYRRLSLETGAMTSFSPAQRLYGRYGFVDCEPFGDYRADPHSVFMTRTL